VLFDQYKGAQVPPGKKSLAYALTLRSPEGTLTDQDADAICAAVVERLKTSVGAEQRA
jgi:phenylalanyl-tRNA synthetase beta chain